MGLKNLSLKDKKLFDGFLKREEHGLSVYAFENIYIWKGLFGISWDIIADCLCVFFKDGLGVFLYLPPLGNCSPAQAAQEAFKIMDTSNKNKEASRIENLEASHIESYRILGYDCVQKSHDYVCKRCDLAALRGNKFKSQRASFNYFIKHHDFEYLTFSRRYTEECLKLYERWMKMRKAANPDYIYQAMMLDSRNSLRNALRHCRELNFKGAVVKVGRKIKGFTIGYELHKDTFCILYEITDLSVKGLAQFIFAKFCSELNRYQYINIMDDSGLENLKKAKLSYHPYKLVPAYIAKRRNGQRY